MMKEQINFRRVKDIYKIISNNASSNIEGLLIKETEPQFKKSKFDTINDVISEIFKQIKSYLNNFNVQLIDMEYFGLHINHVKELHKIYTNIIKQNQSLILDKKIEIKPLLVFLKQIYYEQLKDESVRMELKILTKDQAIRESKEMISDKMKELNIDRIKKENEWNEKEEKYKIAIELLKKKEDASRAKIEELQAKENKKEEKRHIEPKESKENKEPKESAIAMNIIKEENKFLRTRLEIQQEKLKTILESKDKVKEKIQKLREEKNEMFEKKDEELKISRERNQNLELEMKNLKKELKDTNLKLLKIKNNDAAVSDAEIPDFVLVVVDFNNAYKSMRDIKGYFDFKWLMNIVKGIMTKKYIQNKNEKNILNIMGYIFYSKHKKQILVNSMEKIESEFAESFENIEIEDPKGYLNNGKRKDQDVDTTLVDKIAEVLIIYKKNIKALFMISGDIDMKPSIVRANKYSIPTHVVAIKDTIHHKMKETADFTHEI